ncbi:MAG TPA: M28 family peptidase [Candidatus Sulfopaludibacter sp.]|nr:M28 family peptidase [Candidatus Sulfopaludibacter sp.]
MRLARIALAALCCALFATEPNDATRRWWAHVVAMGNDEMGGRDTGSEGYRKAARYVVTQFEKNGLQPAGENGYYQKVPLHVLRLRTDESNIELVRPSGVTKLQWLRQITTAARTGLPDKLEAELVFAGSEPPGSDLEGKIAVQIWGAGGRGGGRGGAPRGGVAGVIAIDSAGGPEPPRWPVAYSVAMTLRDPQQAPAKGAAGGPVTFRFNHAEADVLFQGSGHTYQELADLQAANKPLPRFPMNATLRASLKVESADLESDNILAALPGSDPVLRDEYVVVSAHLDGYGSGEPWNGDRIYNGAFDDEAYVATLIDMAERLHESGRELKRSLLFCVVTGEEKGLLGSKYFTAHPTIAKEKMVADINLDQLRPIFPLKILTMLALDESTLGDTAKKVAEPMGIRIQPDAEPERNLLRRSDHYSFMQIGVPAAGFIFGYEKGSPEEAVYRRWYAERYHSPADDIQQPWDPPAAAKFNDFFNRLVVELANAAERPRWKPGSAFAK